MLIVVIPQSLRSGRLSSSSPAQSIWLPGVEGRASAIAVARTRSTRASILLRMIVESPSSVLETRVESQLGDRCGGASLSTGEEMTCSGIVGLFTSFPGLGLPFEDGLFAWDRRLLLDGRADDGVVTSDPWTDAWTDIGGGAAFEPLRDAGGFVLGAVEGLSVAVGGVAAAGATLADWGVCLGFV